MYKVQQNDTVVVLSGKDRGKRGKVEQILPVEGLIVVEGVNKIFRHVKPQQQGESGQRIEVSGPIQISNVMVVCPACSKPSRISFSIQGEGVKKQKVRMCRKCNKPLTKQTESTKTKKDKK